jgi:primosomal protein N' (replication factor Y)
VAVPVLVPAPAGRPYSYAVPAGMKVEAGAIVRVPLGPREVAGIVWDGEADAIDSTARRCRPMRAASPNGWPTGR